MGCFESKSKNEDIIVSKTELRWKLYIKEVIQFCNVAGLFKARLLENNSELYLRMISGNHDTFSQIKTMVNQWKQFSTNSDRYLKILNFQEKDSYFYIVFEKPLGAMPLLEAINNRTFLITEENLRREIAGLMNTLQILHKKSLVQGRIDPNHIVVSKNKFFLLDGIMGYEKVENITSEYDKFLSPQIVNGEKPTSKSDLWAVGALIHFLITGKAFRYSDDPSIMLNSGDWERVSENLKNLVKEMLNQSGSLTVETALQHPWFLSTESSPIEIGNLSELSEYSKVNQVLSTCINILGTERTKNDLNSLYEELLSLDINKIGQCQGSILMQRALSSKIHATMSA